MTVFLKIYEQSYSVTVNVSAQGIGRLILVPSSWRVSGEQNIMPRHWTVSAKCYWTIKCLII